MLHENRSKVLQIRLSPQEWDSLHNFVAVNFRSRFTVSEFARNVIMSYIYEQVDQAAIYD